MAYLIITTLNWVYLPDHINADIEWYVAPIFAQVLIQLWLFQKTWVEYGFVMRMKMILEKLPTWQQWIAKILALNAVIDDINVRVTWGPVLFPGVSPIPKNKADILMTGLLHVLKSTNPVDSRRWKRADWFCTNWLDAIDPSGDHC